MPTCTIHIGMHKTGSTSIQRSLDGYEDARFSYARLGASPNHSHAIYDLFTREGEWGFFDVAPQAQAVARYEKQLQQAIAHNGQRSLIISGEQISSMHPGALARMRESLKPHFNTIRIVGYVRPPASYLASAFQQRLKKRNPKFEPLRLYRSYRDTFYKFDEIFGAENVELWKFEPSTLHNRCAVSDFCRRLGIEIPPERIRTENESLSRQLVGLLYVYRRYAPELAGSLQEKEVEELNRRLLAVWRDKFTLSQELTQAIRRQFAEDIAWMEGRLGQSLEEQPKAISHAVDNEADLVHTSTRTFEELCSLTGHKPGQSPEQSEPDAVARLFHKLRTANAVRQVQGRPSGSHLTRLKSAVRQLLRRSAHTAR